MSRKLKLRSKWAKVSELYIKDYVCVCVCVCVLVLSVGINPLNAELNPICHLLALLGAQYIFRVSRIRDEPP